MKCLLWTMLPGPFWGDTPLGVCFGGFWQEIWERTVGFVLLKNECMAWLWPTTAINKLHG